MAFAAEDIFTQIWSALNSNFLCLLGALAFLTFVILLFLVLLIKRVRRESKWAYNPEKTLRLRWRRG